VTRERATVVVPCYNEARRIDPDAFGALVDGDADLDLLFVDDGSRDETAKILESLRARLPSRIGILPLERNRGKAEAVRRGLLRALEGSASIVGYLDADLATPADEMARLIDEMREGHARVLLGSRVLLLGRRIERNALRHYLGRVFATAASIALRIAVYDTQCGAKVMRRMPALEAALSQPFLSRWAFDVELIGRMLVPGGGIAALAIEDIREVPLNVWRHVRGSKVRPWHFATALVDIGRIAVDLGRRRRHSRG
jgi:glycosyltransferase involved in cell wall biosynthesis